MAAKKKKEITKVISFKVSNSIYAKLLKYGESQVDDTGVHLSPSMAARRLMLDSLKKIK